MIIWLITDPRNRRETKEETSPLKKKKNYNKLNEDLGAGEWETPKKTTEVQLINFYLRTYVSPRAKEKISRRKERKDYNFFFCSSCVCDILSPFPPFFAIFFLKFEANMWDAFLMLELSVSGRRISFWMDTKKVTCNYTHTHTRAQATKKKRWMGYRIEGRGSQLNSVFF